jgi:hypothetical protein
MIYLYLGLGYACFKLFESIKRKRKNKELLLKVEEVTKRLSETTKWHKEGCQCEACLLLQRGKEIMKI